MSSAAGDQRDVVMFYRDFRRFRGGHLKVWDYFNHVRASPTYVPRARFTEESVWTPANPWSGCDDGLVVGPDDQVRPDAIFLGGLDWLMVPEEDLARPDLPVINIIQHPQHATPGTPRRSLLKNRAVRICLSDQVADAILATGEVNGPVFTIPAGLDMSQLPASRPPDERDVDFLVLAVKQRELARDVAARLDRDGRSVRVSETSMSRRDFLELLARTKVAVLVPDLTEGFYLPALESMALGAVTVCPDCVGNRSFCIADRTCFVPPRESGALARAAAEALEAWPNGTEAMIRAARETANRHALPAERAAFLSILDQANELWERET